MCEVSVRVGRFYHRSSCLLLSQFPLETAQSPPGLRPSKKSIGRLVERLRHLTDPRYSWQETTELVHILNRTLTGWANYFSIGTTSSAYRAVEAYYTTRFRRWLLKKHKSRRNGLLAYPYEHLFETLGLVRLSGRKSYLPWAKA